MVSLTDHYFFPYDSAIFTQTSDSELTIDVLANDESVFERNGVLSGTDYGTASIPGQFGNAVTLDGVDDHVRADGVSLTGNTATFAAWIKPGETQSPFTGIIFDRSSGATGLNFGTAGELRYHWHSNRWRNLHPPV